MNIRFLAALYLVAVGMGGRARSYMGRGWAYLMLGDEAHARADFDAALRLDPRLRPELER